MTPALRIEACAAGSPRHLADLAALRQRGLPLPHDHGDWPLHNTTAQWRWLRVVDDAGTLVSGLAVELRRSRAAPGMRIGRIRRVGRALHEPLLPGLGGLLREAARRLPRLLRLDVEIFDEQPARRRAFVEALQPHGWRTAADELGYRETLRLPLAGRDDDALLAGFNGRTRRNLRRTQNYPGLRFGPVTTTHATRLGELHQASFARSGGTAPALDIDGMLADAATTGGSLLLGCFDRDRAAPDDLIAFAWITPHGDHASYAHAGSIPPAARHLAPGAVIMWMAIRWARDRGFDWFDLGGATAADDDGPLAGITAFKRGFASDHIAVAQTLSMTPSPRLAALIGHGRRLLRRGEVTG